MTIEEAIENLEEIQTILKTQHMMKDMDGELEDGEIKVYRDRFESLNMAISALEKQIHKETKEQLTTFTEEQLKNTNKAGA